MTHPDTLQIPRTVVEQALEALDLSYALLESAKSYHRPKVLDAYKNLRAALQPQADTSVLQAAPWPPAGETLTEPEAMRYDFDGYGWKYIDNGSGSDWMTRHPEGEFLFTKPQALQPQAESELEQMRQRKDAAYLERNQVVAALAKCFPSGVAKTAIEGWSEDWHGCVYINLPTGQVSWHFHDSQAYLFEGLPAYSGKWDGHDTEEKYRRVAALQPQAADDKIKALAAKAPKDVRIYHGGGEVIPSAAAEPVRVIDVTSLSAMFLNTNTDQNQWGHHHAKGWNAALRQAMDYAQPATPPATQAALTAALDTLNAALVESPVARKLVESAIAQIEALKGPAP